jgi:hypothetical protein
MEARHMSLDLEISNILGRGRASAPLSIGEVREISASDLALFENRQAVPASDPIKKISERHHMVAKMLARGAAPGEVARLTGYEPSRISVLKASPAMQELIALYREDLEAEFTPIIETLVGVSKDALNLIRERMEEEGDKIPLRDLISTFEMGADRIGHPRAKDVNTNINVNLGDRLEAARRRAREAAQGIIEAEIIEDFSDGDDR